DSAPLYISTLSLHDALPICGIGLEDLVDPALLNDAVGRGGGPRAHEQIANVFEPGGRAVDQVFGVAVAPQPAADLHLASIDGERSEEHTSELQSRENLVCRL